MKIKCKNKRCMESNGGVPYEWDYHGQNPFYANCPRCKSSIKIKDSKNTKTELGGKR